MTKNFEHIIHKNSNAVVEGKAKLPTNSQIEYGEIAINYAANKETISIKNSNNEIVTFSSDKVWEDTEKAIAASLNELNDTKQEVLVSGTDIKTINNTSLLGSGNISISGLPSVTAADNGKILMVVNGAWALVTPSTIYTGTGTPSDSQGNDGDIYLQTT